MPSRPTPEEIELLSNVQARRLKYPGQPFKISQRLFDKNFRLENYELEDTEFEECDFMGSTMTGGTLNKVRFSDCLFVGNTIAEGSWHDITFKACAGRGPVLLGSKRGKNVQFEDCEFIGSTSAEVKYGGISEQYGSIGGTQGPVTYNKCRLTRMFVNGGMALHMQGCELNDVIVETQAQASVLVEGAKGGSGSVEFGNERGKFSSVTVKNSSFAGPVSFEGAQMSSALFDTLTGRFDLSRVKAARVSLKKIKFIAAATPKGDVQYGLHTTSAKIGSMSIEECTFEGSRPALYLSGQFPEVEYGADGKVDTSDPYTTTFDTLTIRDTPLNNAHLKYTKSGTLTIESTSINGADFSDSTIKNFVLRDVTIKGKVNYTNTVIGHRVAERVDDSTR